MIYVGLLDNMGQEIKARGYCRVQITSWEAARHRGVSFPGFSESAVIRYFGMFDHPTDGRLIAKSDPMIRQQFIAPGVTIMLDVEGPDPVDPALYHFPKIVQQVDICVSPTTTTRSLRERFA